VRLLTILTLATVTAAVAVPSAGAAEGPCPNEKLRTSFSSFLPNCRAYEMVSPVDKKGGDVHSLLDLYNYSQALNQSSSDGDRFTYSSYRAFADSKAAPISNQYFSSRGTGGWSSQAIVPEQGAAATGGYGIGAYLENQYRAFSDDLCQGWIAVAAEPLLVPTAPEGYTDLYRRNNCDGGTYASLVNVQPTIHPRVFEPELEGTSADGSVAVFRATDKLTPDARGGEISQTYLAKDGALHSVCILPNGEASPAECTAGFNYELEVSSPFGNSGLNHSGVMNNVLSSSGDSVYWTAATFPFYGSARNTGQIFRRLNPDQPQSAISGGECTEPERACTLPVSETVSTDPARYRDASTDGSKALFEMTEGPLKGNLYLYDAATESSRLIAGDSLGVVAAADDLDRIFFVSEEQLPGASGATTGEPNLYMDAEGTPVFIALLSETDVYNGVEPTAVIPSNTTWFPLLHAARATPDGGSLVFISNRSLTGYDNTDASSPSPCGVAGGICDTEIFRYEAGAPGPVCISCNPSGDRPQGREIAAIKFGTTLPSAAWLPLPHNQLDHPRVISDDGSRIFFESFDVLLRRDTNGKADVYQWEKASGPADCQGSGLYSAPAEGCLSLISSGESPSDSELLDVSASGNDVFFTTNASLLPQDPGLVDVYDARVGGGYPQPSTPAACEGEACQGPYAPPKAPTPGSSTFNGPGNFQPKAHKKPKPHKKKHRGKKHKKSQKHHSKANRRAGR
jgi:hypothetical protein